MTTLLLSTLISMWLSGYYKLRLPSIGTIRVKGVEAFKGDINTTQDGKQFINWGTIYPGTPTNRSFYIKSVSNEPITLQLIVSNLTFQDSKGAIVTKALPLKDPFHLTWNYTGAALNPKEVVYVVLTLEVSLDSRFIKYLIDNGVKQFYFDITIKPLE